MDGDEIKVKQLLLKGVSPNAMDTAGYAPLVRDVHHVIGVSSRLAVQLANRQLLALLVHAH